MKKWPAALTGLAAIGTSFCLGVVAAYSHVTPALTRANALIDIQRERIEFLQRERPRCEVIWGFDPPQADLIPPQKLPAPVLDPE